MDANDVGDTIWEITSRHYIATVENDVVTPVLVPGPLGTLRCKWQEVLAAIRSNLNDLIKRNAFNNRGRQVSSHGSR